MISLNLNFDILRYFFTIMQFSAIKPVEKTFSWMNYQRRLSKDYEFLRQSQEELEELTKQQTISKSAF